MIVKSRVVLRRLSDGCIVFWKKSFLLMFESRVRLSVFDRVIGLIFVVSLCLRDVMVGMN